jgi:hypothetical protein
MTTSGAKPLGTGARFRAYPAPPLPLGSRHRTGPGRRKADQFGQRNLQGLHQQGAAVREGEAPLADLPGAGQINGRFATKHCLDPW